jgi:hypothetical protein
VTVNKTEFSKIREEGKTRERERERDRLREREGGRNRGYWGLGIYIMKSGEDR